MGRRFRRCRVHSLRSGGDAAAEVPTRPIRQAQGMLSSLRFAPMPLTDAAYMAGGRRGVYPERNDQPHPPTDNPEGIKRMRSIEPFGIAYEGPSLGMTGGWSEGPVASRSR